jgi:MFS family permease
MIESLGEAPTKSSRIAPEILVLGVVSFLTDASSELIFSVLSVFLTSVLGASTELLGIMEGLADFSSSSLDLASGWLSDRTGKRKAFAGIGYALSAGSKALLLVASSAGQVVLFRVVERLGKSVRGAPRDALLGAIAPADRRGLSFGVHKALDRAGAVLGPIAAWLVLEQLGPTLDTFRFLFLLALVPALLAVIVLALFVHDRPVAAKPRVSLREVVRALDPAYFRYLLAASVFSLAYFSFAFLQVNALRVGFKLAEVPLLYALFNATFTVASIPLGALSDRTGRRFLIGLEFVVYEAMLLLLVLEPNRAGVTAGFVLYGIFVAIDDGQSKAYLTDLSGKEHRATAIGAYNFVTGLVYVPASLVAGILWDVSGPNATFGFAAAVTALAGIVFVATARHPARAT